MKIVDLMKFLCKHLSQIFGQIGTMFLSYVLLKVSRWAHSGVLCNRKCPQMDPWALCNLDVLFRAKSPRILRILCRTSNNSNNRKVTDSTHSILIQGKRNFNIKHQLAFKMYFCSPPGNGSPSAMPSSASTSRLSSLMGNNSSAFDFGMETGFRSSSGFSSGGGGGPGGPRNMPPMSMNHGHGPNSGPPQGNNGFSGLFDR